MELQIGRKQNLVIIFEQKRRELKLAVDSQSIKTLYIKPGSPWENGHLESFHDKLRDECLNGELFGSLAEARVILESWRMEYNE